MLRSNRRLNRYANAPRYRVADIAMSYRVLVADDHPLYRDALRSVVMDTFADAS